MGRPQRRHQAPPVNRPSPLDGRRSLLSPQYSVRSSIDNRSHHFRFSDECAFDEPLTLQFTDLSPEL